MQTIWRSRRMNSNEDVRRAANDAAADLDRRGVSERVRYAVQLVIEEMVTNSIKYAFDDELPHDIELTMALDAEAVRVTLVDEGRPFDPSCDVDTGVCRPVPHPAEGGLGIMMVRRICDSVQYRRENDRNVVQMDIVLDQETL